MFRRPGLAALLSACAFAAVSTAWAAPTKAPKTAPPADEKALEAKFDSMISPAEMDGWLKEMAYLPNHVGSAHDKANAEYQLKLFKEWGWDAHIETFWSLYPTPISESLELVGGPGAPFKATLTEPPIPGDASSTRSQDALPAYVAYQGDGDVTAPLVYVNYGMPDDYKALERMGVSVKGKIVIARYGVGWRGLKPKLAQDHGAVGCIIYSDPRDDGYSVDDVYPNGASRPPHGFQRGSVVDMTLYAGDPLTPGIGATKDAKRMTREESPVILKIPTLPISYADAQPLLASLSGHVAPPNWRGSLPITYHVGPGGGQVHIAVKSDWSLKPLYDVVAMIKGSQKPDEWILRGNHHDGWVMGASDPLSGQVAEMGEAKALGAMHKAGWKPKRTIVYLSWDGEEPGLLGSTEWGEEHAKELKDKAVVYINSDGNARGFLQVGGSHDLQHFVNQISADVTDPETGVPVRDRQRARIQVAGSEPGAPERFKAEAKIVADPTKDVPIEALGSGSDYTVYIEHLGLPSLNFGYGGEGDSEGVYHSLYDDYEHHTRFVDPGLVYSGVLAKTVGRAVLRLADEDLPVERYSDFAATVSGYLDEIKKLDQSKHDEFNAQSRLTAANDYKLAADPTKSSGPPEALPRPEPVDFKPMDAAVARLKASASAFDAALAAKGATLTAPQRDRLDAALRPLDQKLARPEGLPFRPWFQNVIYAPGRFTGYGAKTLPGIREAIEEGRYADANKYSAITAEALVDYATGLDAATAIIEGK